MRCPKCDQEVSEGGKFCADCGAALAVSPSAQERSATEQEPERTIPEPGDGEAPPPGEPDHQEAPLESLTPTDTTDTMGEREVWRGRYSNRAACGGLLLTFVVAVVASVIALFLTLRFWKKPEGTHWMDAAVWIVVAAIVAVVLVRVLWRWAKHRFTLRYRLTTERLFVDKGLLSRKRDEIELLRVDDVSVQQGLPDRIFKVGQVSVYAQTDASTLEERGARGRKRRGRKNADTDARREDRHSRLVLLGIEEPDAVKEKIRQCTRQRRKRSLHIERL